MKRVLVVVALKVIALTLAGAPNGALGAGSSPSPFGLASGTSELSVREPSSAPALQVSAQDGLTDRITASRARLRELRNERDRLEREAVGLGESLRDAAAELANVERRISASRAVLAELRTQEEAATSAVVRNRIELARTRDVLAKNRAILHGRIRAIYKDGPMSWLRAVLGSASPAELIARYRYLRRLAESDRALLDRVAGLEYRLRSDSSRTSSDLDELVSLKLAGLVEAARLGAEEHERARAVVAFRNREGAARTRIERLTADEERMASLVGDLETRHRARERAARLAASRPSGVGSEVETASLAQPANVPTISSADAGTLPWPTEGEIVYGFGRDRRADGTVLRWAGVGIAAATGTAVRAVGTGRVELAGHFEGYGPTVIVGHGGGIYTLYLYLDEIDAVHGRTVVQGERVGTVGGGGTPEGPHLEFQIWVSTDGRAPRAEDPLGWLEGGH